MGAMLAALCFGSCTFLWAPEMGRRMLEMRLAATGFSAGAEFSEPFPVRRARARPSQFQVRATWTNNCLPHRRKAICLLETEPKKLRLPYSVRMSPRSGLSRQPIPEIDCVVLVPGIYLIPVWFMDDLVWSSLHSTFHEEFSSVRPGPLPEDGSHWSSQLQIGPVRLTVWESGGFRTLQAEFACVRHALAAGAPPTLPEEPGTGTRNLLVHAEWTRFILAMLGVIEF